MNKVTAGLKTLGLVFALIVAPQAIIWGGGYMVAKISGPSALQMQEVVDQNGVVVSGVMKVHL